jgi:hypothetical protein
MKRRDFVKAMMAASVATRELFAQQNPAQAPPPQATPATPAAAVATQAPAPVAAAPTPWMRGLSEVKPLPIAPLSPDAVAQTNADFFTARQLATLQRFSEMLVPPYNGYPGAVEAGTPKFLDFLIGASPAERQRTYQSGLDRLETEARQRFGIAFADLSPEQADQLIRPWLRTWMTDNPPTEPYAHFINVAHADIRTATINSQAWGDATRAAGKSPAVDLYWYPVDPDLRRDSSAPARKGLSNHRPA